jgi:hypothetical protein
MDELVWYSPELNMITVAYSPPALKYDESGLYISSFLYLNGVLITESTNWYLIGDL